MMEHVFRYTDEYLSQKRLSGDISADAFIKIVFQDAGSKADLQKWLAAESHNNALGDLKLKFPDAAFIANADKLPDWANPQMLKAGSAFFISHAQTIMTLLGLLSLPYCYTAANGAMVLYLSERMRKQTTKRLYDTAVFVWEVMAPDAFETKGKAFAAILKVRLMHAAVRHYTLQSGKWDDSWGVPVNQEDMAGTNLSFSLLVVRGLRKMGIAVSQSNQEAFLHLWNVIGFMSGLEEDMVSKTAKMAQLLDRKISKRQFIASQHGKELTKSLTDHVIKINKGKASAKDILGLMRYLLGKEISDMLAINASELSVFKLNMIRAINLFKSFRPKPSTHAEYLRAYAIFKATRKEEQAIT